MFDLITHRNPKSPISEAFRTLRTNIQFSGFDKPIKTLVITSSGLGEGKTTTVTNLAVAFAQAGSRALIIDADLRRPMVHKLFLQNNIQGLTNVLAGKGDYKQFLINCPVENLDVLSCGAIPPNPSEILASNAMKQFIQKVKEDYDMVFIDSPPVGHVTDAAILSTIADGTILVAASGTVEIDAINAAKELLKKVNANIIGVVLNKLDKNAQGNYCYYYYGEGVGAASGRKHRKKPKEQKGLTLEGLS